MFKKFFQKRIQKDLNKLNSAREKCIAVLRKKGLSEDQIISVEKVSYRKAGVAYVENPDIQAALNVYFESLKEESLKIGYDVA